MPKEKTIQCPVVLQTIPLADCIKIRCKYHGFWSGAQGAISGCQYDNIKKAQNNLLKELGGDKCLTDSS